MVLEEATMHLYVDGFTAHLVEWVEVGDGSNGYLDSTNPDNRIEADPNNLLEARFTFQNGSIPYPWVKTLKLQLYCKRDVGGGDVKVQLTTPMPMHSQRTITPPVGAYGWEETVDLAAWIDAWDEINNVYLTLTSSTPADGTKVYVACARLEIVYYKNTIDLTKNPTSNEAEDPIGWATPDNAHADGGGSASAPIVARKQWYKEHGFVPADIGTIIKVFVRLDARRSAVGYPNTLRYSISKDGGLNFSDHPQFQYVYEAQWQHDFTGVGFTPNDLADGNLVTRIWSGSTGCLTGKCEVGLWIENMDERKRKKDDKIDVVRVDELWDKYEKGEKLPLILGWDWKKGFSRAKITEIIKHENIPCYHIKMKAVDGENVKDAEGSETHLVWECFKGYTRVKDLQLKDCLCSLGWTEKLDDYDLTLMEIILKEPIGLRTVYEILTDKAHIFAHSTMAKIAKW